MFKWLFCMLTGGHSLIRLVIPENDFGDRRFVGKICKICGQIKDLHPED